MLDNLKKILNEDQDPKAIEKITSKLQNILMSSEEIGYIAVQKKPAITVFPDSIVVTNKRIVLCKPKNLGLSMDFIDYDWNDVAGSFVKEGLLGSDFSFSTNSGLTQTIDYLPKNQARKLWTFTKEQLEVLKNPEVVETVQEEAPNIDEIVEMPLQEETIPEIIQDTEIEAPIEHEHNELAQLSKDALFEKLQNYKKLLDNGLITAPEYEKLKAEIIKYL